MAYEYKRYKEFTQQELEDLTYYVNKGFTIYEACVKAGFSHDKLHYHMNKDPEIATLAAKLRKEQDVQVEEKVFSQGLHGCEIHEEYWSTVFDEFGDPVLNPDGSIKQVLKNTKIKKIPPSEQLMVFILRNRMRHTYGDQSNDDLKLNIYESKTDLQKRLAGMLTKIKKDSTNKRVPQRNPLKGKCNITDPPKPKYTPPE